MASRLKTGPNFEEAKVWTEQQIRAGKLDIQELQSNLMMYGFLARRTAEQLAAPAPKTLDRETFDALVKFQTAYRDAVQRMDSKDRRGIDLKPITVDGKAGNQTQEMIIGYSATVELARRATARRAEDIGVKDRLADLMNQVRLPPAEPLVRKGREPLAKTVPVKLEPGRKQGPELTPEAYQARLERIVERGWQRARVENDETNFDGSQTYRIMIPLPGGDRLDVRVVLDEEITGDVKGQIKGKLLAILDNYGNMEGGRVEDIWVISDRGRSHKETELYAFNGRYRTDFKAEKYGESTYIAHIGKSLEKYDRS